ncbi:hypothetical protein ABEF95_014373 [Exophiala dermatitidis]
MSLVTQTQTVTDTATTVVPADTTIVTDVTTTITSHFYTTLTATHGQTVTISSPSPSPPAPPAAPTTKYTPTPIIATTTETSSVTITEIDVYLQNDHGSLYSTWVISLPVATGPATTSSEPPTPLIYVVEPQQQHHGGWDGWSTGAKVGLIVGSVLAGLLLLSLIFWCCKRRKIWVVHGWPWSTAAHVARPPHPGQPTFVNGPVLPLNHPHPHGRAAYGYG